MVVSETVMVSLDEAGDVAMEIEEDDIFFFFFLLKIELAAERNILDP